MQTFLDGKVTLLRGDCLELLPALPENSIDSIVCDPPYHLTSIVKRFGADNAAPVKVSEFFTEGGESKGSSPYKRSSAGFMGRRWDGGDVAFRPETWQAALRVLKPGGYILAFSSSRTFGRMSVAIEDAGFIVHPFIAWAFGQGFPKAHKVDDPEWDGWAYGGQALKPAIEPIFMGQKPFSEKNGTLNIQRWGVGALNIDACRIETSASDAEAMERANTPGSGRMKRGGGLQGTGTFSRSSPTGELDTTKGRWPAHLLHDGSEEVIAAFPDAGGNTGGPAQTSIGGNGAYHGGEARVPVGFNDSGSAARFFSCFPSNGQSLYYSAKASATDRAGSSHPTVKPVELMQWLVRLVTPKGATVLDFFAGTGTTGEAAWREGMKAILIEREEEYQQDIARRMEAADSPMKRAMSVRQRPKPKDDTPSMFDELAE